MVLGGILRGGWENSGDGCREAEEPDSGVDIENNYVWARVTHLSPFASIGFIWKGTTAFELKNLYTIGLDENLDLRIGSKLVMKFYTYGDAFEGENVVKNFSPPWHVEENESARHPEGIGVKKARLDLTTDNTEEMISTIATFTVTRNDLFGRVMEIKGLWPIASPDERNALFQEIMDIKGQWPIVD